MMDGKFQKRIQRYGWNKAATYYDPFWQQQLKPAQDLLLDMADLKPGKTVLDIACGTGLVTFPAASIIGDSGKMIATDISEGMLVIAREIARDKGFNNIDFQRMDAEKIELPDNSVDSALCSLGLMYAPDPLTAVKEMHRTIKPGGNAVAAVWGKRSNCGWAEIFPIVDARVDSDVCPMFFQLGTGESLKMQFEMAGFRSIRYERISTTLYYETAEIASGAVFAGGPVALAYHRFDDSTREEAELEYLQSIEEFRDDKGYHVPGEFVVVSGEK